jgi:hypothetical protein
MSRLVLLTLLHVHPAIAAAQAINAQIGAVTSVASVGLALLTYFIDRQAATMAILAKDLPAFDERQIKGQLARDVILAALTAAGLLALAPFIAPIFKGLHPFQRSGSLRILFLIVFCGYLALAAYLVSIIRRRYGRLKAKKPKKRAAGNLT